MDKKLLYTLALAAALALPAAANTEQTVQTVGSAVTVPEGVDYHIASATPFGTAGSVNLAKGGTATVIFDNVVPSKAVNLLGTNVTIDGEKAVRGTNCDIRIHAQGTIILPYTEKDQPLTVYSEQNYGGTAVSDFGLEDNGGYMNTLTAAKLNNKIRSFKLRRGYMVTFAIRSGGYGYSRCFVAADEDLNMATLPAVLDRRISSYRVFKWNDNSKKGLANNTSTGDNTLLRTTSCYSFGNGGDTGLDFECVRHHIYEGWPSISSIGENSYSTSNPTVKTNNEPGNSADDYPQTVDEVLANWEQLMATGKRLCSPSSHDGSLSWLRNFMDSIDARGWRCDVLDMHCYWPEGSFSGLSSWYNSYKRPIWVSEWVWGASWNKNGVFSTGYTDDQAKAQNATVIKRLIDKMESWDYVERYFYWNTEADRSKLILNGALTAAGEQYANLDSKVGFKPSLQYVPKTPKLYDPRDFTCAFTPKNMTTTLTWYDDNGELNDSVVLERKVGSNRTARWTRLAAIDVQEATSLAYTYKDVIDGAGEYYYRIHTYTYDGKEHYSSEILNSISGATGTADVQWGTFSAADTEEKYNFFATPFAEKPVVVFGSPSSKETSVRPVEAISSIRKLNSAYSYFTSLYFPWDAAEMTSLEQSSYIAALPGNGTLGTLAYEAGTVADATTGKEINVGRDTVQVTFAKPFATAPVVFAMPQSKNSNYPLTPRIWDVTAEGFKLILKRQQSMDEKYPGFTTSKVGYFAIEKGVATFDGKRVEVGDTALSFTNVGTSRRVTYKETLTNPVFVGQLQTFDRQIAAFVRTGTAGSANSYCSLKICVDQTSDNKTVSSSSPINETVGYFVVSDYDDPTGIAAPKAAATAGKMLNVTVCNGKLSVCEAGATSAKVYAASGALVGTAQLVDGQGSITLTQQTPGMLIVRTNTGTTAKVTMSK